MRLRSTIVCSGVLSLLSSAAAQAPQVGSQPAASAHGDLQYTLSGTTFRRWVADGIVNAAMRRDGGSWESLQQPDDRLHFLLEQFDPTVASPALTGNLAAPVGTRLFLVQFQTQIVAEYREAIESAGGQILHYMPANALYVRCDASVAAQLRQLPCVRWVGALQNGLKLDAQLRAFVARDAGSIEANLVLAKKSDRGTLAAQVADVGGVVTDLADGSIYIQARLTPAQLILLLSRDTVVFADPTPGIGYDMDNARVQGGGNAVEAAGNYRGLGVRAEITEFFEETHPDFAGRFIVRSVGVASHGHCTAGIVAGAGVGNAAARGMMPECTVIEGGYTSSANHYAQIQGSVSAAWRSMQATSSWGATQTTVYTSVSSAIDDALFDFDFVRTQSQSNLGNQDSRPEAWAKNMISVGGMRHLNNSIAADDNWTNGASIGPASDGRLKPDICAYYDSVLTSDRTGASGYDPSNYYTGFNGTSAATPIVSGHVGLIQQMFTDGLFGNPLPLPATAANRFENRSHASTVKALLCNTAAQYTFAGLADDRTRTHQGWGFPSLSRLYDNRSKIVVLDEYDTLQVNQTRSYYVWIAPGTTEFRATMVYADPAAVAAAAVHLINDANLKVTRVSDGTFWWGNNGLDANMFSTSGGAANNRDNIECVYLQNPTAGIYLVSVTAVSIPVDAKVETPQIDMDYALVIHPVGGGYLTSGGLTLDLVSTGPGNLTINASSVPATGWNQGYTAISFSTVRGRGFGKFFGLEDDSITVSLWASALAPGNPFHFSNTAGTFPFASYVFPLPGLISSLAGLKIDGVMVLFNGGTITAISNVDRLTLQ